MRVVIDANIFVSFLLTRGETISSVFDLWIKNEFVLLVTEEIILEISQVINRLLADKLIEASQGYSLLRRLRKESQMVTVVSQVNVSPDKKDNRYLAAALDGQADFLVTGDRKHLLPLKKFHQTKIVSPKEFVNLLKSTNKLSVS